MDIDKDHHQKTIVEQHAFFIQGYDIPPDEQTIRNRLLPHVPTLKTKTYRDSLLKIVASLSELDHFSDNLQKKVDNLLQAQQTTFVQSYKIHIETVKGEFDRLNQHISELQQKVRYYENEGKMSSLVKKVFQLEQQSTKLFKTLAQKDKKIRDLQLTIKVLQKEMLTLRQAVKTSVRERSQLIFRDTKQTKQKTFSDQNKTVGLDDIMVFPTQIGKKSSIMTQHQLGQSKPLISKRDSFINQGLIKSNTVDLQEDGLIASQVSFSKSRRISIRQEQLQKQNFQLKLKNKKLVSHHARIVDNQFQLQQFFVHCVEQLKKQIRIRKKIDYCSLQEFMKQDKLLLLIKVLSNNQILSYLHERLFHKNHKNVFQKQDAPGNDHPKNAKLPQINFNLTYQKK